MKVSRHSGVSIALILLIVCGVIVQQSFAKGAGGARGTTTEKDLDDVLHSLPEVIRAGMEKRRLAGLSVAVVRARELIYSGGFGFSNLEDKTPASSETVYPIASVTKVFTAVMLAQLCDRGVVGLETSLNDLLPGYEAPPRSGAKATTLRQLASHTSGLPEDAPVNFWCNYTMFGWVVTAGGTDPLWYVPTEELLAGLDSVELEHAPDVYSHYSNLGMQLLGIALERACGEPFPDYIEAEILGPLGMEDSGFDIDDIGRSRLAQGYVCLSEEAQLLPAPMWEPGCALYSGGLCSTVEDMARFVSLLLSEEPPGAGRTGGGEPVGLGEETGAAGAKPEVLSASALRRMRTPGSVRRPGEHDSYGLGWAIVEIGGHDAVEHNGALLGHTAHASAIPELDIGIVVLANSRNFMWSGGAPRDLAREIYGELIPAVESLYREPPFDPETADLGGYEGRYRLPGGVAHMEMAAQDGVLLVSVVEDPEFSEAFVPLNRYEFCFAEDPARTPILFFGANEEGVIETATFLSFAFRRVAEE
jgi:CubicO group peptidase (beta-lactamase class C family)